MKLSILKIILLSALGVVSASAEDYSFGGDVRARSVYSAYPSSDIFGIPISDSTENYLLQGRLNFAIREDNVEFVAEGFGGFQHQSGRARAPGFELGSVVGDRTALFDLQRESDGIGSDFYGRVDRLSLGWRNEDTTIKFGRMALTWGQGMTFQVLDIVNPFPPATIDPEYKPGSDMIYLSNNLRAETRIEFAVVPRRDIESHAIEAAESTFALRWVERLEASESEVQITAAQHYDKALFGLGYNVPIRGAIARADILVHEKLNGGADFSFIANMDRSWELFDRNWYGSLEYFHSGVGGSSNEFAEFSPELTASLSRGDLFTVGTDYVSFGCRQEVTPLFNFYQLWIQGLNPVGSLFQLKGTYDLTEDWLLIAAGTFGFGDSDSEFQGIQQNGTLIERGDSVFVQIGWYF
jgi:hypothetical protein